jgi:hypothetical protein
MKDIKFLVQNSIKMIFCSIIEYIKSFRLFDSLSEKISQEIKILIKKSTNNKSNFN